MGAPKSDPAPQPEERWDLFLSYARDDTAIARRIAHDLAARGVKVFFDVESLTPGIPWIEHLNYVLTSVDAILILISESSLESRWVQKEWQTALQSKSVRLLPVLISASAARRIPPVLADLQYVDLAQGYESGLERIVRALPKLHTSKAPDPAAVVDMDRLVREVADRVAERLGVERQRTDHGEAGVLVDNSLVFVITSFAEEMEPIFDGISAAASQVGLRAERVKDILGDYRITEQVMKMIQSARLIVADLSLERPNVYFELGYARGLDKTVVTIMRAGTKVHFDVKDWTYMTYTDSRLLERDLVKRFEYEISR